MLHTNDISNKTKINKDNDEFFHTLDTDTDTDNDDSNIEDTATASKAENDDSISALSGDTAFYDLIREAKLLCFPTKAMNPIVEAYQTWTGIYLRIKRSINDRFRVYECREHLGCPFEICISRRRSDGLFVVSKMKNKQAH
jgi:hypothetical protein